MWFVIEGKPKDCMDIKAKTPDNGVYTIYPERDPVDVYCDMSTEGGGWTVGWQKFNAMQNYNWAASRKKGP